MSTDEVTGIVKVEDSSGNVAGVTSFGELKVRDTSAALIFATITPTQHRSTMLHVTYVPDGGGVNITSQAINIASIKHLLLCLDIPAGTAPSDLSWVVESACVMTDSSDYTTWHTLTTFTGGGPHELNMENYGWNLIRVRVATETASATTYQIAVYAGWIAGG